MPFLNGYSGYEELCRKKPNETWKVDSSHLYSVPLDKHLLNSYCVLLEFSSFREGRSMRSHDTAWRPVGPRRAQLIQRVYVRTHGVGRASERSGGLRGRGGLLPPVFSLPCGDCDARTISCCLFFTPHTDFHLAAWPKYVSFFKAT